jgi:N-acetyl-gamma-glutamyl-phosphate reductase
MTKVHLYGASGYASAEAIRLLRFHPHAELGMLESVSHAGEEVGAHFPQLRTLDRRFDAPGSVLGRASDGDLVILGGAQGTATQIAPQLLARGARAIDLSGEFRLQPSPAVYGFPELYRDAIAAAPFVANPGCYPTAALLATLPLARFEPLQIVVDAKSGITGAGRTPSLGSLFAEVAGEIRAYALNGHRHEPEILQAWRAEGIAAPLVFTPHVVPLARGMLVDAYAVLATPVCAGDVRAIFERTYAQNPFTRVLGEDAAPSVAAVAGTNDAEIAISVHGAVVRVICAIDNLGRGAAGSAIRNFNLMYGYAEEAGLQQREHAQT